MFGLGKVECTWAAEDFALMETTLMTGSLQEDYRGELVSISTESSNESGRYIEEKLLSIESLRNRDSDYAIVIHA